MATVLFDLETSIPTAIRKVPPLTYSILIGYSSSESIHIRWLNGSTGPNLLNRMQNNEGWLTHFSPGVVSQFEIS